jgi:hypothetical protein
VAALIVTGATEGWAGIGRLLRRIVRWRVGLRWYLFVLLGLPALMVLGTFLRPGALASFDVSALPSVLAYLGPFAFMVVLGGPLFEEPGWRGFALPRLQRLHGPLIGGLIPGKHLLHRGPRRGLPRPRRHRQLPEPHHRALALVIIAVTRGRLGYRPEASEAPRVR